MEPEYMFWEVAILDFPLQVRSGSLQNRTIGKLDPENMGEAVEILFLSHLEAELCMGCIGTPLTSEKYDYQHEGK